MGQEELAVSRWGDINSWRQSGKGEKKKEEEQLQVVVWSWQCEKRFMWLEVGRVRGGAQSGLA